MDGSDPSCLVLRLDFFVMLLSTFVYCIVVTPGLVSFLCVCCH